MTYDIGSIAGNITSSPSQGIAVMNMELGGWIIAIILYVSIFILYALAKNYNDGIKDSDALLFGTFTISVVGLMLFLIPVDGSISKIISWLQLLPMIVLTGILIILNFSNRNY